MSALALVERIARTRQELEGEPERLAQLRELQRWQTHRLQQTYADVAADDRYRAALDFFVHDLYGPHDVSGRHRDLHKVLQHWERLMPQRAMHAVMQALELEALSQSLDVAVLDALHGAVPTATSYASAYRTAGRRGEREHQIALIVACGRTLDSLVAMPAVGLALRAAHTPARLLGVKALQDFLERGYAAFKDMGGAEELLHLIERRELGILEKLFAGANDPFRIDIGRVSA